MTEMTENWLIRGKAEAGSTLETKEMSNKIQYAVSEPEFHPGVWLFLIYKDT